MIYALVNGQKVKAQKGEVGICPLCDEPLIPRCGNYKVHHWSHKNKSDCDSWAEGETEWHLGWKSFFPVECQEVTIVNKVTQEKHRADIKTKNEMVIELQNSPITDDDIITRTSFYGRIIWIVNGTNYGFAMTDFFNGISKKQLKPNIYEFTYFGRSKLFEKWSKVKAPVFIDFTTSDLYWIKKFDQTQKKGIVQIITKIELIEKNGGLILKHSEEIVPEHHENKEVYKPNEQQKRIAFLKRYKNRL